MIEHTETRETEFLIPSQDRTVNPPTGTALLTALDELGLVGMWKDRTDIGDSSAFARELRERSAARGAE